jgi:sugar porter (SP) family MFS transporter
MTLGQASVPSSHTPSSHTDNDQATTPTAAAAAADASTLSGGSSSAEKPASYPYTHTHTANAHSFSKPASSSSTHQLPDLDKVWEATKSFDIDDTHSPTDHNTRPLSTTFTATTATTDPGLLFASNQSNITATTAATTNMDFQNIEAESLLSAAAQRRSRRLVYMCGFCASLTSILLGYDVGIMSVARKYVDQQLMLSSVQSEVVMGSLNLIAAFGGLIAGKTADHFGRNRAIAIACLIFLTGSACMTLAWNFRVLLVGRVVTGLGVGCGFVIAPVYIAEICPPEIRGRMVSLTDVCINVGIVLGSIVGFLCEQTIISDDVKWRVMLGIGIIPPIVILLCLRFLPESPRWLLLKDRVPEARHVLRMIVGRDQEAERELVAIEETIALERDVTTDWSEVLWPRHRAILLPGRYI